SLPVGDLPAPGVIRAARRRRLDPGRPDADGQGADALDARSRQRRLRARRLRAARSAAVGGTLRRPLRALLGGVAVSSLPREDHDAPARSDLSPHGRRPAPAGGPGPGPRRRGGPPAAPPPPHPPP